MALWSTPTHCGLFQRGYDETFSRPIRIGPNGIPVHGGPWNELVRRMPLPCVTRAIDWFHQPRQSHRNGHSFWCAIFQRSVALGWTAGDATGSVIMDVAIEWQKSRAIRRQRFFSATATAASTGSLLRGWRGPSENKANEGCLERW